MGASNAGDTFDMIPEVAMNLGKDIVLISSSEKSKVVLFNFWKCRQSIMFRKNLRDNNFVQFLEDRGKLYYVQKKVKGPQFCSSLGRQGEIISHSEKH